MFSSRRQMIDANFFSFCKRISPLRLVSSTQQLYTSEAEKDGFALFYLTLRVWRKSDQPGTWNNVHNRSERAVRRPPGGFCITIGV